MAHFSTEQVEQVKDYWSFSVDSKQIRLGKLTVNAARTYECYNCAIESMDMLYYSISTTPSVFVP